LKIERIILREIRMRLVTPFETSFGRVTDRRILLIELECDGVSGWGECVAGEGPFYASETVDTAWLIIRDFLWPLLKGRDFTSAAGVRPALEKVRGHNMAKAAVEAAAWDAEAKQKGISLSKLLGGVRSEIACGVSIGIKETLEELIATVERELAAGYQRIKIKIKPGHDIAPVETLRLKFPRIRLMVDANSAYRLEDWPHLKRLEAYYLMMIEQPLGWDDIFSHVELQRKLDTPICLDECIHTVEHAKAAIDLGACRIINMKLGRVGGYAPAKQIHDLCLSRQIPVWCGGMLESGIGRAHNIALSTLENFSLPGDVTASRRYWLEDVIDPEVTVTPEGTIWVPEGPGIGYQPRMNQIESITARKEVLT
jgi:o-succinylbenzoate synthase